MPIEIVDEREAEGDGADDRDVRIVTPGGLRIEGLTTTDAIAPWNKSQVMDSTRSLSREEIVDANGTRIQSAPRIQVRGCT